MSKEVIATSVSYNPTYKISPEDKARGNLHDTDFMGFCERMSMRMQGIEALGFPIFRTNADPLDLWQAYLSGFDNAYAKQYATCVADEQFIRKFGGLVYVDEKGEIDSLLWEKDEQYTRASVLAMRQLVLKAKITGVFIPDMNIIGRPLVNKIWANLHGSFAQVVTITPEVAYQREAVVKQNYILVSRTLAEYDVKHFKTFQSLLEGGLPRAERFTPVVHWWLNLYESWNGIRDQRRRVNRMWDLVARAPEGFLHIKNGTVGNILGMLQFGSTLEAVKDVYTRTVDPSVFQRPQAAPSEGNIKVAEKKVSQLGLEPSFPRRHAMLSEIPEKLWEQPAQGPAKQGGGMFSHLTAEAKRDNDTKGRVSGGNITLERFLSKVMPKAKSIWVMRRSNMMLTSFVTAVHADAPPILQWDLPEQRNPFSTYVYRHGSSPEAWSLPYAAEYKVLAVVAQPHEWYDGNFDHHGSGAVFVLEGCRDGKEPGLCLFPEMLKAELREIKSVVEAHSNSQKMVKVLHAQNAAGVYMGRAGNIGVDVVVDDGTILTSYHIDRGV